MARITASTPLRPALAPKPRAAAPARPGAPAAAAADQLRLSAQASAYTPLQRHAEYFDVNGDHVITVDETRQSLRDLGMGKLASRLLSVAINAGFGFQNAGRPTLTIDIDKIQHTRNRSHSGVFTEDGQFDPAAFTRMFDRFDTNHSGSLSESEIRAMIKANAKDPIGPLASKGEFGMLMAVAADATETVNGKQEKAISRANMAAFYDGSLLYKLAEQHGHPHRAPEA